MKISFSVLACTALLLAMAADGQEEQTVAAPESALVDQFNSHLIRSANRIDLGVRRLLSGRQLRFSVGRYWIDQYESLINERDREVGIWGIDASSDSALPEFDIRR